MDNLNIGNEPIYIKVYNNFKTQILNGLLKPNEKLPSVRDVATSLTVNPNTVQKAYTELERDGLIYSVMGKGNFVSEKLIDAKDKAVNDIYSELNKLINQLMNIGIDSKTIMKEIEKMGGNK